MKVFETETKEGKLFNTLVNLVMETARCVAIAVSIPVMIRAQEQGNVWMMLVGIFIASRFVGDVYTHIQRSRHLYKPRELQIAVRAVAVESPTRVNLPVMIRALTETWNWLMEMNPHALDSVDEQSYNDVVESVRIAIRDSGCFSEADDEPEQ